MPAADASRQGLSFIGANEGFVSHYYSDAGGVGTIGYGFTTLSKTFNAYWQKTRGHKLRKGDTLTAEEGVTILAAIVSAEYAPPVAKRFPAIEQAPFDAATDMVYNCGAGSLKDQWAKHLATGDTAAAANALTSDRVTAGGRRLAGLVKRRLAEAKLMLSGVYAGLPLPVYPDEIQTELTSLGFKSVTDFQKAKGLVVDGVVGPATRAAIQRALDANAAKTVAKTVGGGGTAAGAATHVTASNALDPHMLLWAVGCGAAVLALVGLGYLAWSYRGVILRKRTPA